MHCSDCNARLVTPVTLLRYTVEIHTYCVLVRLLRAKTSKLRRLFVVYRVAGCLGFRSACPLLTYTIDQKFDGLLAHIVPPVPALRSPV